MVPPIETAITPENVKNLTDAEIDIVLNSERAKARIAANFIAPESKKPKKESKETLTKSLEFEKDTFKISSK